MPDPSETARIVGGLRSYGHALTSASLLGLDPDTWSANATVLDKRLQATDQMRTAGPDRAGMLMFRDEASLEAGRVLVRPIFEAVFCSSSGGDEFGMYCVNHYEAGHAFRPHQDYFDGTVVIATISGTREFDIYRAEDEDDVFVEVEATCTLEPGSIMLLDGYSNRGHAARCLHGPSVSVVADIALRPDAR
jgi:hypothetical protein